MKKIITFALIISMLILALVSCGEQTAPSESVATPQTAAPTGEPIMSDEPSTTELTPSQGATEPTETTSGTNIDEPKGFTPTGYSFFSIGLGGADNFVETPSKIIFLGSQSAIGNKAGVYYYSKADGEFYPFCFDPLCQHQDLWDGEKYVGTTCVARMLHRLNGSRIYAYTSPQYCNGRIYFPYFDEIWSCNEYATDIRIDVSFSKLPSDITKTEAKNRMNKGISCFQQFMIGGNSVFFDHLDADGEVRYYRLDTETRKLHDLTEEMEDFVNEHGLENLYFNYAIGNYIVFNGLNAETKKVENITTDQNLNPTKIPFLGENDTLSVMRNTANGQFCGIRRFDEEHNLISTEYVEVFPNGECKLIDIERTASYATDNYLYYPGGESVFIGYGPYVSSVTGEAEVIKNKANGIVRYNRKTGEEELIFQNDFLYCNRILYVNEETGEFISLAELYKRQPDGTASSTSNNIYVGKLVDGKLEDFHKAQFEEVEEVEHPSIPGWD